MLESISIWFHKPHFCHASHPLTTFPSRELVNSWRNQQHVLGVMLWIDWVYSREIFSWLNEMNLEKSIILYIIWTAYMISLGVAKNWFLLIKCIMVSDQKIEEISGWVTVFEFNYCAFLKEIQFAFTNIFQCLHFNGLFIYLFFL